MRASGLQLLAMIVATSACAGTSESQEATDARRDDVVAIDDGSAADVSLADTGVDANVLVDSSVPDSVVSADSSIADAPLAEVSPDVLDARMVDSIVDTMPGTADAADTSAPETPMDFGPTPPTCGSATFLSEDVIARASVALESCLSDDGYWRTQNSVRGTRGGFQYAGGAATMHCLAAVTNGCAGVFSCYGLSPYSDADTCGACVGDSVTYCSDRLKWDCTKFGGTCVANQCIFAGRACDAATFAPSCDAEGNEVRCYRGNTELGTACTALGLTCTTDGCVAAGSACVDNDPFITIGDNGLSCKDGLIGMCHRGKLATFRCACLGENHGCQSADGHIFCGTASDCDPRTTPSTCDGTKVVFCNAGKRTTIDCTSLGFTSCSGPPTKRARCG